MSSSQSVRVCLGDSDQADQLLNKRGGTYDQLFFLFFFSLLLCCICYHDYVHYVMEYVDKVCPPIE